MNKSYSEIISMKDAVNNVNVFANVNKISHFQNEFLCYAELIMP